MILYSLLLASESVPSEAAKIIDEEVSPLSKWSESSGDALNSKSIDRERLVKLASNGANASSSSANSKSPSPRPSAAHRPPALYLTKKVPYHRERVETKFVIVWISVENSTAGTRVLQSSTLPASVSRLFHVCLPARRREPLAYIPELPPQLQPSPQVTAAVPSPTFFPPAVPSHLQTPVRPTFCPALPLRLRMCCVHAALSFQGMRQYPFTSVVARERDKERERLRRGTGKPGRTLHGHALCHAFLGAVRDTTICACDT
ncbi:hypothetical protein C8R46DRAFT_1341615 [Mycena filopes]|nr:hypothetical protein C8R46DRAFT_1341615 [Mycena filopes]